MACRNPFPDEAKKRNFFALDATCPLVTKVHREAEIHHKRGRHILLIGHAGHPEVVGTIGQLPAGAITLIESVDEVATFVPRDPANLAYVTQTTLSVDDTADMVAALKAASRKSTGRTRKTSATPPPIARRWSSRWRRGSTPWWWSARRIRPIRSASRRWPSVPASRAPRWSTAPPISTGRSSAILQSLGVTAGASAPEVLVEEVIAAFAERYDVKVETVTTAEESMFFPLPRVLRENEAAE